MKGSWLPRLRPLSIVRAFDDMRRTAGSRASVQRGGQEEPRTFEVRGSAMQGTMQPGTACTTIGLDQCGLGSKALHWPAARAEFVTAAFSTVAQKKYSRGLLPPPELRMRPPSAEGGVHDTRRTP